MGIKFQNWEASRETLYIRSNKIDLAFLEMGMSSKSSTRQCMRLLMLFQKLQEMFSQDYSSIEVRSAWF